MEQPSIVRIQSTCTGAYPQDISTAPIRTLSPSKLPAFDNCITSNDFQGERRQVNGSASNIHRIANKSKTAIDGYS